MLNYFTSPEAVTRAKKYFGVQRFVTLQRHCERTDSKQVCVLRAFMFMGKVMYTDDIDTPLYHVRAAECMNGKQVRKINKERGWLVSSSRH